MEVEFRVDEDTHEVVGYIPFNKETVIGGLFREVIRPGFFSRAIEEGDDVVARAEHGMHGELPFARTTNGSLKLIEHEDRLEWRATPVKAIDVDNLIARMKARIIDATSFAFQVNDSNPEQVRWDESEVENGKLPLRELKSAARVLDVSPVTFAAYEGTSLGFRAEERSAESVYEEFASSTSLSGTDEGELEERSQVDRDMSTAISVILNHKKTI
jgi:HK97 family phage prohead protease